jgi:hypothetical protein
LNSAINANFISPLVVFGVMEVFASVVVIAKPLVPKKPQNSISNLFSQLRLKSLCQNCNKKTRNVAIKNSACKKHPTAHALHILLYIKKKKNTPRWKWVRGALFHDENFNRK